jgi:bla regulator protein blaR1
MTRMFASLNLIAFAACRVLGQSAASPAFDVVPVKPSDPSARGMNIGIAPGGRFTATNATVQALIEQAYDVRDFQISGGPGWINTERYDIAAKADDFSFSEDDVRKMTDEQRQAFAQRFRGKVRALLADRFQLKVRRENKDLPVYALVVTKNGPRIQASKSDDSPTRGIRSSRTESGKTEIAVTQAPLTMFAQMLSSLVGRTVLEKTDLKGTFDFKVTFGADPLQQAPGLADDDPTLFTALQEQLGLKLDAQKGPVEIVVIESVEKPSEN